MKKCIFVSIVFAMLQTTLYCQNKQQFWGIRASGGVASFTNDKLPNRYKPNGLSYDIGFGTHVVWQQKIGFSIDFSFAKKDIKDDVFKYSMNYLNFGFLPTCYFNDLKTSVFIGGNASILLYFQSSNTRPKNEDVFYNFDVGFIVGANQLLLTLSDIEISAELRLSKGFMDVRKEQPFEGKTYNYGGSLGLVFRKQGKQAAKNQH